MGLPATGANNFSKGDRSTRLSQTAAQILNSKRTQSSHDPKNMAVIGIDELQRIRQQCAGYAGSTATGGFETMDEEKMRTQERLALQEKSKARIANWPNTMQAMRKKREDERIQRLEDEELERRRIDQVEFELQQEARLKVVERANKVAYQNQDIVKAFNSKLLMSDVLAEREIQKSLKAKKREHEKAVEREWEELDRVKMEAFDEKVKEKLVAEYDRKVANTKAISDQLHEFKMKYIKRMQDDMLEAELINRQVKEELEREAQKELDRKRKQLEQKETFRKANNELLQQQERERLKALEQERQIDEYARKKAELDQLKKDREEQKFAEKQATRQKLIERQSEVLRNMKNKEDEILNKQVEEAEEKALKLFEEQERRRQQLKEQIEKSRAQQIQKKRDERDREQAEQRQFSEYWKLRSDELQVAEHIEKQESKQRSEDIKEYLRK